MTEVNTNWNSPDALTGKTIWPQSNQPDAVLPVRPRWRIRLARWILSQAAWLAWRIAGKAAYGRGALEPRLFVAWVTSGLWGPE